MPVRGRHRPQYDDRSALVAGALLAAAFSIWMLFSKNYQRLEKWIMSFVSLEPPFGRLSAAVFALGLLFAGLSSSITAAMAGGSVFAGIFHEPFDINAPHSHTSLLVDMARG